jgi:hypothetical protein
MLGESVCCAGSAERRAVQLQARRRNGASIVHHVPAAGLPVSCNGMFGSSSTNSC